MRVVHLASQHQADDVRIFLKECRSLAKAGFEVHLVAPGAGERTLDGVVVHGFALPAGYGPLRVARRLWRVWRAARPIPADVCHFHELPLVPVALLLKLRGMRIVYDVHEDPLGALEYASSRSGAKRFGLRLFEALARRSCDAFVAATPAIARRFPPERTVEVLNYAQSEEFSRASQAASGADVVYVGLITRARGLVEMVEAARRLQDPEARLVLIGSFETTELEREAQSLAGWSRVEYLGRLSRSEVGERLATARAGLVVFHPERNHTEALPNKLFEYMSAGIPLIASDFPYWHELLDPVGCAVFVDPLDPARIAAAVDELLADEGLARQMGQRGTAAVRDRFNWEQEAPKLVELYERLGRAAAA